MLNFTWSQCEYLRIDGKIYMNILRYKRGLRCVNFEIRLGTHAIVRQHELHYILQLKHLKNVINDIYFM